MLAEAEDPRVLAAAARASASDLCQPVLIGDPARVRAAAGAAGVKLGAEIEILDPQADPALADMAQQLAAELTARGIQLDSARNPGGVLALAHEPLYYADLLVRHGRADGAIMGAVATTADTVRAALRVLGLDPRFNLVTSCFLMAFSAQKPLLYADCGVIPQPTAEQLAVIAIQAAERYRLLLDDEPRVALLSFSTHGSARHPALEPVQQAVALLKARSLDFVVDGELQADAALVPDIARRKAPHSPLFGQANVLVFPDLNSGNIAYKLTERLAGARAIGPLLSGFDRPVHDLSRGCSVDDILDTMAIAAIEAASGRRNP